MYTLSVPKNMYTPCTLKKNLKTPPYSHWSCNTIIGYVQYKMCIPQKVRFPPSNLPTPPLIIAHEMMVSNSVSEYTHGPWKVSGAHETAPLFLYLLNLQHILVTIQKSLVTYSMAS